jgi:hypothetical protein
MVLTGMKKISVLTALGMLMIAPWGMAQTIYDGAKLTGKDLNGTARFVGMGGAMGALGETYLRWGLIRQVLAFIAVMM